TARASLYRNINLPERHLPVAVGRRRVAQFAISIIAPGESTACGGEQRLAIGIRHGDVLRLEPHALLVKREQAVEDAPRADLALAGCHRLHVAVAALLAPGLEDAELGAVAGDVVNKSVAGVHLSSDIASLTTSLTGHIT